eukprot:CAMPEP_0119560830 /NCGR_PEP_ID=MMETSP1352-20130426/15985_1 /TAXON_ID=265584 /ORGANISM="Stauroneis constricta, Strain CCMP1120" /LENGTH=181 /DNA_ID=CAMNT_0007608891 /DNA_START=160 /DNA_END=701 /DNA_ORIENTATION=-
MGNQPSTADGEAGRSAHQQQHHGSRQQQHNAGYAANQQPPPQYSGGMPFGASYNSGNSNANAGGGGSNMQRSTSDASMTLLDADKTAAAVANSNGGTTPTTIDDWLDDNTVPTVFRWEHGGRQVYITGTFNGWSRQIPMHRSGNDFTYIHNLKRGKHAFKFIVDDEWRFAPDQPTVADVEG